MSQVLPLETMQRLIRMIRDACEVLYITGGEPLLRSEYLDNLVISMDGLDEGRDDPELPKQKNHIA
jgi:molybdenum cofactor biosynthesis enzyme MoaA